MIVKFKDTYGYQDIIAENDELLEYLALGQLHLNAGEQYVNTSAHHEVALVLLSGTASISCEGEHWVSLGDRKSVFEGKATVVYVPILSEYVISAESELQIAICKVKADTRYAPFVVKPKEISVHNRGRDTWQREVHDTISERQEGAVQRIILGESFNAAGNWSSYPPHKHDGEHAPEEPNLEEIYHFQIEPSQGFGVQVHYTKDGVIDHSCIVRHGDSYGIKKGYHPVVAAGGCRVYYLWFMAGESGRKLSPYSDPDFDWLG